MATKQVYGKYGTLAKMYLEEHEPARAWALGKNLPEYLHGRIAAEDRGRDPVRTCVCVRRYNDGQGFTRYGNGFEVGFCGCAVCRKYYRRSYRHPRLCDHIGGIICRRKQIRRSGKRGETMKYAIRMQGSRRQCNSIRACRVRNAMRFALSSKNTESAKSISFGKGTEQ